MRAMKPAEYRAMSDEQLDLTLKDTIKNLFHLRFQSATERLETPSEIRKAKQRRRPHQDDPARAAAGRGQTAAGRRGVTKQWPRQRQHGEPKHAASGASRSASSPATR